MELIDKQDRKIVPKSHTRMMMAIRHTVNTILDGGMYSVLISKLMEDDYGLGHCYSQAQAERIVRAAREMIRKDTEEQLPSLRDDMISRFLDIYTECREIGDRMNALKALEHINKICGLYQDKVKVDCDISGDININFDFNKE